MLAKVCSAAVNGVEAYPVEVEVNAGFGDTLIVMNGLKSPVSREARRNHDTVGCVALAVRANSSIFSSTFSVSQSWPLENLASGFTGILASNEASVFSSCPLHKTTFNPGSSSLHFWIKANPLPA
jgi:hypothetical protein